MVELSKLTLILMNGPNAMVELILMGILRVLRSVSREERHLVFVIEQRLVMMQMLMIICCILYMVAQHRLQKDHMRLLMIHLKLLLSHGNSQQFLSKLMLQVTKIRRLRSLLQIAESIPRLRWLLLKIWLMVQVQQRVSFLHQLKFLLLLLHQIQLARQAQQVQQDQQVKNNIL